MSLNVLGVSHRTASAPTRAAVALTPGQVVELLGRIAAQDGDLEAVVLSTCNRTEFYVAGEAAVERLEQVLASCCPAAPRVGTDGWFHHSGQAAFAHLLRVASGMDSALLGDGQIIGQLRRALSASQQAGALGAVLSPAVSAALRFGRRARAVTDIGQGAPGIGPVIADVVRGRDIQVDDPVLVLGAAEAARATVRALQKVGYRRLVVVNRTLTAARRLATDLRVEAAAWSDIDGLLQSVAAVVVATGAPAPTLTSVPGRDRPLLVIDAGFPPQVGPGVRRLDVDVIRLEALTGAADAASQARLRAVPQVERLLGEEVTRWQEQQDRRPVEDVIKQLHAGAGRVAEAAVQALVGRAGLSATDIERVVQRELKALLHEHAGRLRSLPPPRSAS